MGDLGYFQSACQLTSVPLPVVARAVGLTQRRKDAKSGQKVQFSSNSSLRLCAFAPLREVKAGIDEPFQNGLPWIISFCLPVSLTPFHHPRARLQPSHRAL
jgi:hypothetical protein